MRDKEKNKFSKNKHPFQIPFFGRKDKKKVDSNQEQPGHKEVSSQNENKRAATFFTTWIFPSLTIFITAWLAWYTTRLYKEAANQSYYARQSALAAQKSADAAVQTYEVTKSSVQSSDSASKKTLELSGESLKAQIGALNETRNEFKIENRPLIQLGNMKFNSIGEGVETNFEFGIINFGKQPLYIVDTKFKIYFSHEKEYEDFSGMIDFPDFDMIYIPGASFSTVTVRDHDKTTSEENAELKNGSLFIYLLGKIVYDDRVDKERRLYKLSIRLSPYPLLGMHSVINDDSYLGK